jgi:hypothetical protein
MIGRKNSHLHNKGHIIFDVFLILGLISIHFLLSASKNIYDFFKKKKNSYDPVPICNIFRVIPTLEIQNPIIYPMTRFASFHEVFGFSSSDWVRKRKYLLLIPFSILNTTFTIIFFLLDSSRYSHSK